MPLSEREKFENFVKLAELGFDRLERRRGYEWKINFGIWTVLAVMVGFGVSDPDTRTVTLSGPIFILMHFAAFLIYVVWTAGLQISNKIDQRFGFNYEDKAEDIANEGRRRFDHKAINKAFFALGGLRSWSIASQVSFTVLLFVADVWVYWPRLGF